MAAGERADCADWIAIRELSARYNRAFDEADQEAFGALFVNDGVLIFRGTPSGDREAVGRDAIRALAVRPRHAHFHITTDAVIEIEGDQATQVCALFLTSRAFEDGQLTLTMGRYFDTLTRTAEGWRFTRREGFIDSAFEGLLPMKRNA
jgi:uncharacterized protein (TIGR02246 family)